jgi:hypothetical protein
MTMMIILHNYHKILEWLYEKLQQCNDVQKNELLSPKEMKPRWTCPKQRAEFQAWQPPPSTCLTILHNAQNTFRAAPFISYDTFNEKLRLKNYYAVQSNNNLFDNFNLKNIPHKMLGLNLQKSVTSEFLHIFIHSKWQQAPTFQTYTLVGKLVSYSWLSCWGHTILMSRELMWCYTCSWDVRGDLTLNSMAQIHTSVTLLTSRDLTWSSGRLTRQHASRISVVACISQNMTCVSSALQTLLPVVSRNRGNDYWKSVPTGIFKWYSVTRL